ncbi:hypothetical protein CR513_61392, partial [Mucuna pruriens]
MDRDVQDTNYETEGEDHNEEEGGDEIERLPLKERLATHFEMKELENLKESGDMEKLEAKCFFAWSSAKFECQAMTHDFEDIVFGAPSLRIVKIKVVHFILFMPQNNTYTRCTIA